jgi:alpha-amylase
MLMADRKKFRAIIFLLIIFISACSTTEVAKPTPTSYVPSATQPILTQLATAQATIKPTVSTASQGTDGYAWWNNSVFYEIFVRSFYDSNHDGIGDINGILEKLDYLNDGDPNTSTDLGINGIWLMPIFPSPSYHGYDVINYYAVNPDYGTLEDFTNLIQECHKRGMHVIIDLPLNHTSSLNPWFLDARDQPGSKYRDWYIWSDTNPGYLGPWDEKVWYASKAGYYYAIFSPDMPDLNFQNDYVTHEMYNVAKFWLQEVGVDGFRLDAARYLIESERIQADTQITHDWWKNFRTFYKGINPQAMTIGEVWTNNFEVLDYVQGDELDMAFNFDLASQTIRGISSWNAASLAMNIDNSYSQFPKGSYATFLTNHDQNRVMSTFAGNLDKAKLAAIVMLTAPGTPFIYYGEEIGMVGAKPDENIRTPMLWSADKYAGFSAISPWESVNSDFEQFNVETESTDPDSLLSVYRRLIKLRNEHSALSMGDYYGVHSDNGALLSFLRVSQEETLLVIINLSKKPVAGFTLSLDKGSLSGSYNPVPIFGEISLKDLTANANGGFEAYQPSTEIPASGLVVIQLRR